MAKGQVYFDGSGRGRSVDVAESQIAASLGGGLPPQSEPGFGPDSIGAQHSASLPKSLDPFAADPFVGGSVTTPSGKQVHRQLPGRKVSKDG